MSGVLVAPFIASSLAQGQLIYWTELHDNRIRRANFGQPGHHEFYSEGGLFPYGIDVDSSGERVYWTANYRIQRARLDGSEIETLVIDGNPREIELDAPRGKMYWTDSSGSRVLRANLDGTQVEPLTSSGNFSTGLALDVAGGKMYWINAGGPATITSANLDGSDVHCLIGAHISCDNQTMLVGPTALEWDVSMQRLYWTDPGARAIFRANADGSSVEPIVSDAYTLGLDIWAGNLYWSQWVATNSYVINRSNLDGEDIQPGVSGLTAAFGLVVTPEPSSVGVWLLAGSLFFRKSREHRRGCQKPNRLVPSLQHR